MEATSTAIALVEAPVDIPVVCAWCGATIREGTQGPASHGLCLKCEAFVLVQSGLGRYAKTPDVYTVMGRLAKALEHRRGWPLETVCAVLDGICQQTNRVGTECEVAWLAHEEGLDELLNVTEPVVVDLPLAAA